uniref:Transposase n=1 Tax=Ascaris lumbricoides TaxID=6252 RepID=A0A0M3HRY6_ASCLU
VPIQDGVYIEAEVYSVHKRSLQQRLRKKTSEHLSKAIGWMNLLYRYGYESSDTANIAMRLHDLCGKLTIYSQPLK